MNPEILQKVIQLVSDQTGVEALSMDGDDAADLLAGIQVDFTGFEFSRHFGPEAPFAPLHHLFTDLKCLTPVTIGDLAAAAERGSWKPAG